MAPPVSAQALVKSDDDPPHHIEVGGTVHPGGAAQADVFGALPEHTEMRGPYRPDAIVAEYPQARFSAAFSDTPARSSP
jgi:hypothetical protein